MIGPSFFSSFTDNVSLFSLSLTPSSIKLFLPLKIPMTHLLISLSPNFISNNFLVLAFLTNNILSVSDSSLLFSIKSPSELIYSSFGSSVASFNLDVSNELMVIYLTQYGIWALHSIKSDLFWFSYKEFKILVPMEKSFKWAGTKFREDSCMANPDKQVSHPILEAIKQFSSRCSSHLSIFSLSIYPGSHSKHLKLFL